MNSQDISFSDPYSEKILFSPAYSGLNDCAEINLSYNKMYLSNYYSSSYNKYFSKYKSGLGTVISNNSEGNKTINNFTINLIYTYKILLSKKQIINTAFQIGYYQQSINTSKLIFSNQINPITNNISKNTSELLLQNNKDASFTFATSYISERYRFGFVFKHIDKLLINSSNRQLNPALKLHFAKSFLIKKMQLSSSKNIITPEIIYNFQNSFHNFSYGLHLKNNIFLIRYFISHNSKFNTVFSTITLGATIKNIRLSYSYNITFTKHINLPISSNQLSLFIKLACSKKRNNKNTIYCMKK